MSSSGSFNSLKDVRPVTFQTIHDLLEAAQSDALLTLLQPVQRGRRKAKLSGKFSKRHVSAFFAKKDAKFLFKLVPHGLMLVARLFHLRNN